MSINVTITVIIPIYNMEKYLTKCLESVVGQSIPFDEVILINDGSTDKSQLICEKYILKYNYFKLINQENRGLSVARNVGMDYTTSKYVLFLDSDDYLRADTAKQLKHELEKFGQDAVYFDADIECENGYEVSENYYDRNMKELSDTKMNGKYFFEICYPENYIVSACMAVYKKEMIETGGITFPEGLYYEDNYFTFAFMIQANNVTYIPEKLYQRRYRENSITTSSYSQKKFNDYIKIVVLLWETVCKHENVFLTENNVFFKFINDYCHLALKHRRSCVDQNIPLQDNVENEFYRMVRTYELLVEQYNFDDKVENLVLLNSILKNLKEIVLYLPKYKVHLEQLIKKLVQRQKRFYKKLLCDLPLNVEGCKVGIYGTGRHTQGLLTIYTDLIGKIMCNLIFIDSYKENKKYLNKDIIHYQKIDNSFDLIIISSFFYKQEMIDNVRKINNEIYLFTFYDFLNEDVFSEWDLFY